MIPEELLEKAKKEMKKVSVKHENRILNVVNEAYSKGYHAAKDEYKGKTAKITPNGYQEAAMRTSNPSTMPYGDLIVGALGLAGESGEVADHVKKFVGQGHELSRRKIIEEVGDVLWYVALTLEAVNCSMEDCMRLNIDKLKERYPDGFETERSVHRDDEEFGNCTANKKPITLEDLYGEILR